MKEFPDYFNIIVTAIFFAWLVTTIIYWLIYIGYTMGQGK
jgi:hypothetical protein